VFSALATTRTDHLLAVHRSADQALVGGYGLALRAASAFLAVAGLVALGTVNSRGEPEPPPAVEAAPETVSPRGTSQKARATMPHVLFVYDSPDSLAALPEESRRAVHREYQALAEIPEMVGHRIQPGVPGTRLTVTDDQGTNLDPIAAADPRIIGFYLVATDDFDRAAQLAARIPAARRGGAIAIHRLAGE
jgi:hypothetical protein